MKLTPQQAKEKGYTRFAQEGGESAEHIDEIINGNYYYTGETLMVLGGPSKFFISKDVISDLLHDYLFNQDDVHDVNEVLPEELDEADFDAIEKLVNVGFTERWWHPIDIELDMSGYKNKEEKKC